MASICVNGETRYIPEGSLLSSVLAPAHALEMPCAGAGRCGKCRVTVRGAVSALSEPERRHLSQREIAEGVRLACCTHVEGDCTVSLPQRGGKRIYLGGETPEFAPDPVFSGCGAAIDIGTTTLAARLYAPDGRMLAQAGMLNPQAGWGADVISRIGAARHSGGALAAAIRGGVNTLLSRLARQAQRAVTEIDAVVLTGNTAMLYLLTGTDPECLSHAPFEASCLFGETRGADALELSCPHAAVYLPHCISAFVGADITTALLASGICNRQETCLLVDIGTNGEAALWHDGTLYCCSTAAGPAFEGAGLSMGMGGEDGAIDHVSLQDGALSAHVIGDGVPKGICGSGVIDALACLLELEQMDETGRLEADPQTILPPVCLTQKDVRMAQLAKSAVFAGMETLLDQQKLAWDDVASLSVAGGFGSYLDLQAAGRIGLLPPKLLSRVRVLGNAALSGAALLLLDRGFWSRGAALASRAQTVDLSANETFKAAYLEGMLF